MYYCAPGCTFACSVHVLKGMVFCIIKALKRSYFDTVIMFTNPVPEVDVMYSLPERSSYTSEHRSVLP